MLSNRAARVFAYASPCDMRKQMDGLSTLVREQLEREPEGGDLYLFRNRRGDMIKILFFNQGGYCLLSKRLVKGTFQMRLSIKSDQCAAEITQAELSGLLTRAELVQEVSQST